MWKQRYTIKFLAKLALNFPMQILPSNNYFVLFLVHFFITNKLIVHTQMYSLFLSPNLKVMLTNSCVYVQVCSHNYNFYAQWETRRVILNNGRVRPFTHLLLLFVVLQTFTPFVYNLCFERLGITVIQSS